MEKRINYAAFRRLDLRIGRIIEVVPLEGSQKLYLLRIDLAEKEPRQLVAGLRPFYSIEELLGKKVVLVANLEPRQIYSHISQGMLLAAEDDYGKVSLLVLDKEVEVGARVR